MNWITIMTLVVTAAYLIKIGVIPSISDSYRTISDIRVYHTFFFISGALIACQAIYSPESLEIPYVVTGFLFFSIGMAAAFWKKGEGLLHVCFTYGSIIGGLTLTIVRIWPYWGYWSLGLVVLMAIGAIAIQEFVKSNRTYWQEVWAYVVIFGPIVQI